MLSKKKAPRLFEDSSSSEDDHGDQVPKTKPNSNKVKKNAKLYVAVKFLHGLLGQRDSLSKAKHFPVTAYSEGCSYRTNASPQ